MLYFPFSILFYDWQLLGLCSVHDRWMNARMNKCMNECAFVEWWWQQGKTNVHGEKPVLLPLYPPQIPQPDLGLDLGQHSKRPVTTHRRHHITHHLVMGYVIQHSRLFYWTLLVEITAFWKWVQFPPTVVWRYEYLYSISFIILFPLHYIWTLLIAVC